MESNLLAYIILFLLTVLLTNYIALERQIVRITYVKWQHILPIAITLAHSYSTWPCKYNEYRLTKGNGVV